MVTTRDETPSSSIEKHQDEYCRLFDRDFSLSSYGRADDPLDMAVYDPETGISHLESLSPYQKLHINTAVVCTGGSCRGNGKPSAAASYGCYFGEHSNLNLSGPIPSDLPQTNQFAALYSIGKVLERMEKDVEALPSYETALEVVIVSNSSYAVYGLTRDISKWSRNGFKNSKKKPVANGWYLQELHESIEKLTDKKIKIRFWLDNERKSRDAYILARSVGRISHQPIVEKLGPELQYLLFDAIKDPKARKLAKKLGFRLPRQVKDPSKASVVEDSDKNWELLFGPTWKRSWLAEASQ